MSYCVKWHGDIVSCVFSRIQRWRRPRIETTPSVLPSEIVSPLANILKEKQACANINDASRPVSNINQNIALAVAALAVGIFERLERRLCVLGEAT
jgi:hypothetical protein